MSSKLFLSQHLGIGDHLVTNAIVRGYATDYSEVVVPCKHHNLKTVKFMFRDLPHVKVVPVDGDDMMLTLSQGYAVKGHDILGLGSFGNCYDHAKGDWDRQMYNQAGMVFEKRWTDFFVKRDPKSEIPARPGLTFLHQDVKRGFVVDKRRLPSDCDVIQPFPTETIFNWWSVLEEADEIHCIDSSFAILVDSIPTRAKRLVLHLYARPGARPPTYKKPWNVLK